MPNKINQRIAPDKKNERKRWKCSTNREYCYDTREGEQGETKKIEINSLVDINRAVMKNQEGGKKYKNICKCRKD